MAKSKITEETVRDQLNRGPAVGERTKSGYPHEYLNKDELDLAAVEGDESLWEYSGDAWRPTVRVRGPETPRRPGPLSGNHKREKAISLYDMPRHQHEYLSLEDLDLFLQAGDEEVWEFPVGPKRDTLCLQRWQTKRGPWPLSRHNQPSQAVSVYDMS